MKFPVLFLACSLAALPLAGAQETYGTIKATTKLRPDGSKATTIVDPEKNTAEETIIDAAGRVQKKTTFILGEHELAIGAIFSDAKGKVIYKASYQRDPAGHVTEASFSSPDDRYLGKRVFVYDAQGNATQVIDYDANGQLIAPPAGAAAKAKKRR